MMNRDNNFTEKQLRGLDMCVKSTSKTYKFIKGWSLSDDYMKYTAHLYLDLYVDWFEISEMLGYDISPYWLGKYEQGEDVLKSGAISSFMVLKDGRGTPSWGSPEQEEIFNKGFDLNQKIKKLLNDMYTNLPEEFKITWYSDIGGRKLYNTVSLDINQFIQNN